MNSFIVTEHAVIDAPVHRVWEVVSRTDRYAEWVAGVIEVTRHHGVAVEGETYAERNRTLGPLSTSSVWTVRDVVPMACRVDTGTGFAPLRDMTSIFEFQPIGDQGRERTEMTYQVEYSIGLGPLGQFLNRIQEPGMRVNMRASMANLDRLLRSEATATAP
ncbi:SRPBCC family protein [Streptomyces sp. V2]|uniref:SRPBCC family protein n=1 Tax=Streptomyces TaxID=1883 RepID=UPI0006EB846D|nr:MULTISPECIES: SRPBCC family protein [Streptomyces]PWG14453.1 SRPBCC family protein [Streptomyces sp. V2]QZZ25024.1 SRPBCC family protein [Streptomyces sp. ST1015]